ncbi:MAG TPA: formate dehydrogenase cytochrome b556 subunit, partial [Pseudomonas sp.]|nr:formate dehydrogenase cytochrome b556 subunit [Pseudomonas sp.]
LLLCMLVLLVTGVVIWREYFSHLFGIELIRLSVLLHALAAFVLIASIIIHVYAGIWVKGSMGAMLTGWVSRGWARKHHAQWYKEQVSKQEQKP